MRTLQLPLILFLLHGERMSEPSNPSQLDKGEASTAPLQPMGFAGILDTTFSLYRNHFRLFVGISAVYFTSHIILSTFGHWLADWCETALVILSYAGLAFASAGTYLGRRIKFHTAFRQVVNRFKSYAGSGVLWLLVVLALSFTVIGIPVAIFLGTRWCFFPLTVLVEENSATTALRRSGELVKGAWWRVFGILLAIVMIALTIELIFFGLLNFYLCVIGDCRRTGLFRYTSADYMGTPWWDEWLTTSIARHKHGNRGPYSSHNGYRFHAALF